MSGAPVVRDACPGEASALSALALRSKGHWGYDDDFLEACRDELRVDATRIGSDDFYCAVAGRNADLLGFYSLAKIHDTDWELDALFVEPAHIGTGVGAALMQHALRTLRDWEASRLVIQGDPNAVEFYIAAGARQIGTRESGSVPGRLLPLFEIRIGEGTRASRLDKQ